MDDFIIILNNKEECKDILNKVGIFLNNKLKLELNSKTRYFKGYQGVSFCGYRVFTTHILLRGSNKNKMKRKINNWNKLYEKNTIDLKHIELSYNSWLGHIGHTNCFNLKKKMLERLKFNFIDDYSDV